MPPPAARGRPLHGFTLVELLVVIAIIGLLVALVFPAVQAVRATGRRIHCLNNVRQLATAFNAFAAVNGRYPTFAMSWTNAEYVSRCGGTPGDWYDDHGWYSQLGPFIEQMAWHNTITFEKSFSDPVNLAARRTKIPLYACPDDGLKENEWTSSTWARVRGNYVVNAGNTNFGQTELSGVAFLGAPFGPRQSPPLGDVVDGLSTTLMLAEIITTTEPIIWGGAISDITTALGGNTFNGWLPPNSPVPDSICGKYPQPYAYNGIPGVNFLGTDRDLTKQGQFAARSKHGTGVNVARCDGSAQFVANTVDLLRVWRPLTTARGSTAGEVLQ